jgi:NAD(P)H-dependent FMN reductase
MKILTIYGGPRKNGNTATLLRWFVEMLTVEFTVDQIDLSDYTFQGCLGCDGCQGCLDEPGCVQEDDANAILAAILAADCVLYAAPVYAWSFPAPLKALIDRHFCLVKWNEPGSPSLAAGKLLMLLMTCGGTAEENADLPFEAFRREAECLKAPVLGRYVVDQTTTPTELGDRGRAVIKQMVEDCLYWMNRSKERVV